MIIDYDDDDNDDGDDVIYKFNRVVVFFCWFCRIICK